MVSRRRGAEGSYSTRGQTLRIAEYWYVILLLSVMVAEQGLPACSARGYWFHLGALLPCYQARQLFACGGV
jgi:hypothetical protein